MDTNYSRIGDRIKQLRKENNMTQRIIAKKMGTTEVAISNWETGKNELRGENLLKIAEILGVSSTWLQTGNGKQHHKGDSSINNLPDDVKEVITLFQQLTPKQQQRYTEALQETIELNQYKKLP
jgi:transcriptional regulator with XRE-family HTH domain